METQDPTERLTPVRARVASGDTSETRMMAYLEHDDDLPTCRLAVWKAWTGYTNDVAANAIGVSVLVFANMLNGTTARSVRILEKFERATGIPAADWLRATTAPDPSEGARAAQDVVG